MEIQEILVCFTVTAAVFYLLRKFVWKKKENKHCGNGGCGCH